MCKMYAVSGKKLDQNVFYNVSYKTRVILVNLVHHFLNKFAAKSCKQFPLNLNNVSVHYLVKLKMLIEGMLPLSCYTKKFQNLSHLIQFARFESSGLHYVGTVARELRYTITDLNKLKQRQRMEWANWIMSLVW